MNHAHILLVEDEKDIADLVATNITNLGHKVTVIANGSDAIKYVQDQGKATPDLFILDRMLPGVSGIEICKFLRMYTETKIKPISLENDNKIFTAKRAKSTLLDNSLVKQILNLRELYKEYCKEITTVGDGFFGPVNYKTFFNKIQNKENTWIPFLHIRLQNKFIMRA